MGQLPAFNHFIATDQAQSTAQLLDILKSTRASRGSTRWRPTRKGSALYADIGSIPNVSDEGATATPRSARPLRGDRAADPRRLAHRVRLGNDPDAAAPGIFGPARMPYMFRATT